MALNVPLLRGSFELVAEREPEFAEHFYETLFRRHPQVEPLFRRERATQAKMLTQALVAVLEHLEDAPWLSETLGRMGAEHVGYGVTEEMYGWVGECLLATIADVAGSAWSPELETVWSQAYGALRDLMIAGARAGSFVTQE